VKPVALPSKSELESDFAGRIGVLTGWGKTADMGKALNVTLIGRLQP